MIATAPGKLILTGEYAVLGGAPALVIAVTRRVVAQARLDAARGPSPFLRAVAAELAARRGPEDAAARAALEISVDSSAFYGGVTKLGLGSSAAVTVAATALALGIAAGPDGEPGPDRELVREIAMAAHASAQGARGARGSGADVAAAVHGGALVFSAGHVEPRPWPAHVRLISFFTGHPADTATLVARVAEARRARPGEVEAALSAIADASRATCEALGASGRDVVHALQLAGEALDRLVAATRISLVPDCVRGAQRALAPLGGAAKTTGAGGGDVAIAVVPATTDATEVARRLIEVGCQPLDLSVDPSGVDLRPIAS